ncbi:MAG TPA: Hsp70 family protein, partial [Arthrobacter sp.]|nr:Hsp70 family protein [Arthrobacter sp.]
MSYVLAIDVGTSFTAAAIARTDRIAAPVPESLPLGLRGTSVPSVIYYPEEGPILVGEAAERRGLDSPDRVVREFKRRIGDEVPISVGTLSLPAEEVFATMAGWVVDRAAEREGEPPSQIILSHPAAWGGHRTAIIQEALAARGLPDVTLISEPEAAALHYASQVRVEDGSTIAVYDLGGGTFDTAILRKADAGRFEFLGRPEGIEGLGGADFDAAVLRHVAAHTGEAFAALNPDDAAALAALARLKRECVEAKEALSADSEASISVFLPGVHQQVRLVRSELEAMIEEPLRETVDALERSLDELGLEADDLTAVLLIGGSSRIPLVAQLISEQLDRPIAVDADPKSSICLGAAVAALRTRPVAAAVADSTPTETAVSTDGVSAGVAAAVAAMDPPESNIPTILEPHAESRRASWSRKSGTAFGSTAGTGAQGVGARGHGAAHPGAHAPGAKAGSHMPRPTVRLTAVAAAAALFTVLTATAAQSPEGLESLTAMFAPQQETPPKEAAAGSDPDSAGAASGGGEAGAAAGAAGGSQAPVRGIEASAKKKPASTAGIEVVASPTSKPTGSATAPSGTGGAAAGTSTGETGGATSDPAQGTSTSGTPTGTPTGTTPTTNPDPTTNPGPDPTTDPPAPEPDPTTVPPAPEPDPTTDPPAPEPDPTTDPPAPEP